MKKLQKEVDRLEGTCVVLLVVNSQRNTQVHSVFCHLTDSVLKDSSDGLLHYIFDCLAFGFHPLPSFPKSSCLLNVIKMTCVSVEIL